MNIFAITSEGELVTPQPGNNSRRGDTSEYSFAGDRPWADASRTQILVRRIKKGLHFGEIREIFAVGTAAVVNPIIGIKGRDLNLLFPTDCQGHRA